MGCGAGVAVYVAVLVGSGVEVRVGARVAVAVAVAVGAGWVGGSVAVAVGGATVADGSTGWTVAGTGVAGLQAENSSPMTSKMIRPVFPRFKSK